MGIIALPLSIVLALASGVGSETGIFTAIVTEFVISALGGSNVQITEPTAAFATILAGVFLILMGLCHFGILIKFIPCTITTGFTSGIAITIVIEQLKDFFGLTYPKGLKPIETTEKMDAMIQNFSTINTDAVIVGAVSFALLIIAPYIFQKIPASLLSCVVADGMINGKHRSDMELVAQGAGNIASAFFGGIPATGAIARTAANIKNGGRTPIA